MLSIHRHHSKCAAHVQSCVSQWFLIKNATPIHTKQTSDKLKAPYLEHSKYRDQCRNHYQQTNDEDADDAVHAVEQGHCNLDAQIHILQ